MHIIGVGTKFLLGHQVFLTGRTCPRLVQFLPRSVVDLPEAPDPGPPTHPTSPMFGVPDPQTVHGVSQTNRLQVELPVVVPQDGEIRVTA